MNNIFVYIEMENGAVADVSLELLTLDMESITALNNGLVKFQGVLIFSSRDQQIVETTANRIMEIVNGIGKCITQNTASLL